MSARAHDGLVCRRPSPIVSVAYLFAHVSIASTFLLFWCVLLLWHQTLWFVFFYFFFALFSSNWKWNRRRFLWQLATAERCQTGHNSLDDWISRHHTWILYSWAYHPFEFHTFLRVQSLKNSYLSNVRVLFFLSWETIVLIESKPTVDVIEFNVMLAMSCMKRMGHNGGDVFIFYWRDDNNKSRRESIPLG